MYEQKFEETDCFIKALQMLLCVYFVFNRTYPKSNVCMLLFIEMNLCNIISEFRKKGQDHPNLTKVKS